MDVAHDGAGLEPVERLRARVVEQAEQVVDVERKRRHPARDLPLPDGPRPVCVDLDPVAVGVAEVDRLADVVIREPLEPNPVTRGMGKPAREIGALRNEQREVEEPRVAARRTSARLLDEHEQLAPGDTERRAAVARLERLEADNRAVVVERGCEVRHAELDRAHRRVGRDLGRRRARRLELLRVAGRLPADVEVGAHCASVCKPGGLADVTETLTYLRR